MKRNIGAAFAVIMMMLAGVLGVAAGPLAQDGKGDAKGDPGLLRVDSPLSTVSSSFNYEGTLILNNAPASGNVTLNFKLFNALSGGFQIGSTISVTQAISNGQFSAVLNYGNTAFLGEQRFIELAARPEGSPTFTTIAPRQQVLATPYAQSVPWLGVNDKPQPFSQFRFANALAPVDTTGDTTGQFLAVTIGSQGLPIVVYADASNGDLQAALCNNLDCSAPKIIKIATDSTIVLGRFPSATLGSDGLLVVSYYDVTNGNLNVYHCANSLCTTGTTFTVDSTGNVGQYTSITIGGDSLPLISYYDVTNGNLKVAHCGNAACTVSNTITTLDGAGVGNPNVGQFTSSAAGVDGLGIISYYDVTNGNLKVASCFNATCNSATPFVIDGATGASPPNVGKDTSIAIGADGLPLISYFDDTNDDLKVAHCAFTNCNVSVTLTAVVNTGSAGFSSSLAIGADGLGVISYYTAAGAEFDGTVAVAHCKNVTCNSVTSTTLDTAIPAIGPSGITIGIDGLPFVAYQDTLHSDVRGVHCGSTFCASNVHRR